VSRSSRLVLNMRNCKLYGGDLEIGGPYHADFGNSVVSTVTLTNNSFEGVSVNISGTEPSDGGPEVSFTACNNLFKGGAFFHLRPEQSSFGNWVLKNNLFDHMCIIQELDNASVSHPLDYDNNAYWPPSQRSWTLPPLSAVIWVGTAATAHLQPTADGAQRGVTEPFLDRCATLSKRSIGDFYLPNNTQLYGSRKRYRYESRTFSLYNAP